MAININIPSQVKEYDNLASFPATGSVKTIYVAKDTNKLYRWSSSAYVEVSASANTGVWGSITGTLSNQTDLQTALNGKFDDPTGTSAQYIDGTGALQTFPTIPTSTSVVQHAVKAGEALTKGQAVYVSDANGTNMIVSKASNTTEGLSSKTMGLITTDLALNGQGYVITEGLLAGLNTNSATVGDPVWLGTNGNLIYGLTNKPYAPSHLVYIGIVTRKNANNGEIFVRVQNGFELKEIHDVSAQSPSNEDVLMYESSTGLWKNKVVYKTILSDTTTEDTIYIGVAPYGTATSATGWYISKIVVGTGGTQTTTHATGIWNNRTSLIYS